MSVAAGHVERYFILDIRCHCHHHHHHHFTSPSLTHRSSTQDEVSRQLACTKQTSWQVTSLERGSQRTTLVYHHKHTRIHIHSTRKKTHKHTHICTWRHTHIYICIPVNVISTYEYTPTPTHGFEIQMHAWTHNHTGTRQHETPQVLITTIITPVITRTGTKKYADHHQRYEEHRC